MIDPKLKEYCNTALQEEYIDAVNEHGTIRKAAKALGHYSHTTISDAIQKIKGRAAQAGYAPDADFNRPVIPGFATKRVSTAKKVTFEDGTEGYQWHIQERERQSLEVLQESLRDVFADIQPCKPIRPPQHCKSMLASCYLIGDSHIGMYAYGLETGSDDYDVGIGEGLLISATQRLVARSPDSQVGYLINLGDFLHVNDSTSTTPNSKHLLDSDGRLGRIARHAGVLLKTLIELMLQKHERVVVINARGNHDPDASLWLNEICRAYFCNEPRVEIKNNLNKFVWFTFGNNLVVTHHGDKINWQRMYEAVTKNLHNEWGRCKYRFGWTGHLHHEESKEIGGMKFERFGVLPPPDAWHASLGYGAERTMTCIVLHKERGRDTRIEVNADEIKDDLLPNESGVAHDI